MYIYNVFYTIQGVYVRQGCIQDFGQGGRTWSMSKRGGARLFVAAEQLRGGGVQEGDVPLHKIFTYLR